MSSSLGGIRHHKPRTSLPCPVYKALFATTTFSDQPTVSCLQGLIRYDKLLGAAYHVLVTGFYLLPQTSEQPHRILCTGVIHCHRPLNSLTVSSVLVLFTVTDL